MDRGFLSNIELRTPGGRLYYGLIILVLLATALVSLFPFFFAFTSGLKGSTEIFKSGLNLLPVTPQWSNYQDAWSQFSMTRLFMNSFTIVIVGVIFRLSVSTAAAYSLSQLKPIGGRLVIMCFLFTLMTPGIAYFVPLYVTIGDLPIIHVNLLNSYWGLWLPYAVDAFTIFVLKTFFDRIPSEIVDSAKVDGASPLQTFIQIVLPLSRSILIVLGVLAFVAMWKDFLLPLLVITDPEKQPITVRLVYLANRYGVNLQMAASFIALLPPLLIAIILQRYMKVGLTIGAVKG
ncbi:MAG TPA: carbohydrate ABC transporter permease [Phototrophicaceae bacterium]|nr:carbohydrate ABC transporter permease [Phototrophicaceae bacterium]